MFAPKWHILASTSGDSVMLWNPLTGARCGIFESWFKEPPREIALSNDGQLIAMAFGSHIEIRSVRTRRVVMEFERHALWVFSIEFSAENSLVLSVSHDSIWIWDPVTGKNIKSLDGFTGFLNFAHFSPDGSLIASSSEDRTITLWKASTGDRTHVLTGSDQGLYGAIFSPDGKVVVTPSRMSAKTWDTSTGAEIARLHRVQRTDAEDLYEEVPDFVALSKDGSFFAEAVNNEIRIWKVTTGALLALLEGHTAVIRDLEFSPAGGVLASASSDHTSRLWKSERHIPYRSTRFTDPVDIIALSPDGFFAAFHSLSGKIRIKKSKSGLQLLRSIDVHIRPN